MKLLKQGSGERDWRHVGDLADGTKVYAAPKCAISRKDVYDFVETLSSMRFYELSVRSLRGRAFALAGGGHSSLYNFTEPPVRYACPECGARTEAEAERKCAAGELCPMAAGEWHMTMCALIDRQMSALDGREENRTRSENEQHNAGR